MRIKATMCLAAVVLAAGCATESTNAPAADGAKTARNYRVCDEPITGSHVRRCVDEAGNVQVISGRDWEQSQRGSASGPKNPESFNGR